MYRSRDLLSTIGNPSHYAHDENRVAAPGISNISHGSHVSLPSGSMGGGPEWNSQFARGKVHSDFTADGIVQNTNGFATWSRAQSLASYEAGDTSQGQVTFMKQTPVMGETDKFRSHQMLGLTELNRRMQMDPAMRKLYGSELHATKVMKDFVCIGVQINNQTLLDAYSGGIFQNNYCIRGRVNMPNIWLAQDTHAGLSASIGELTCLRLLWRRYKYTADALSKPDAWGRPQAPVPAASATIGASNRKRRFDATASTVAEQVGVFPVFDIQVDYSSQKSGDLFASLGSEPSVVDYRGTPIGIQNKAPNQEYFWRCEPYSAFDRAAPHPALYNGSPFGDANNQFVGDQIYIGQVIHVIRGDNNRDVPQMTRAREALYTKVRGDAYLKPLALLDKIEVMLGCGHI